MNFVVDENMSRKWAKELKALRHEAEHWLKIGKRGSPDTVIMQHAKKSRSIVLTCDLDFGDILAATGAATPSVVQLRPGKMRPEKLMPQVMKAIERNSLLLKQGALLTIDLKKSRARALPLTL